MRKFIPILSFSIGTMFLQHCAERTEETQALAEQQISQPTGRQASKDSAKTSQEPVDPDPPVRDGDHWRSTTKK